MSKMKHLLRKLHIGGSVSDQHRLPDTHRGSPSSSPSPSASSLPSSVGQASSSSSSVSSVVSANSGARMADGDAELRRNGVDFNFFEEEFQVQLALVLSASDPDRRQDAETAQIDAVKRISLGGLPGPVNSALLDFLSLRYWGLVEEAKLDAFNLPYYAPSLKNREKRLRKKAPSISTS